MTISQTSKWDCTTCKENKITRLPKSNDEQPVKATKPHQRVYTDLCGPIDPKSQAGHRNVMSFIDKYSSMLCTYCLQSKSDAVAGLKHLLTDIAPKGTISELHSDGKYMSSSF